MTEQVFAVRESYLGLVERAALSASGLAVFLPAAWLLAVSPEASWRDWLAWALPLALWSAGFLPALLPRRPEIQTAAGFALLAMPWFLDSDAAWLQPSIAAFGVVVGAVFALPTARSLAVVLLATAVDVIDSVPVLPGVAFTQAPMPLPLLGPALVLVAGLGLVVTMREWRRVGDELESYEGSVRQLVEDEHQAEQSRLVRDALHRRVHETVLNTLTALSIGIPASSVPKARAQAREGVEQLDAALETASLSSFADAVRSALAAVPEVRVDVELIGDTVLDPDAAQALRDGVVEALRNVARHSGASAADVRAVASPPTRQEPGGSALVEVRDRGRGFDAEAEERFGVRNSLRSGIEAVGGRAEVSSEPGAGTTVLLSVPASRTFPRSVHEVTGVSLAPVLVRSGLLATNAYLAVAVWPMTDGWADAARIRVAVIALVVSSTALVLAWGTRWRPWLAAAGTVCVAAIAWAALPAAAASASVTASEQLGWLVLSVGGGGSVLLVLAFRRTLPVVVVVVSVLASMSALTFAAPAPWRLFAGMSTVVGVVYLVAVAMSVAFADGLLERRRFAAMSAWDALAKERAAREAHACVAAEWDSLDPRIRGFLTDVIDGAVDPSDDYARLDAAELAGSLRATLAGAPEPSAPFRALADELASTARQAGVELEVSVASHWVRADAYPRPIVDALAALLAGSSWTGARVTALVDAGCEEIVLRLEGASPTGLPHPRLAGDCAMAIDTDDLEPGVVVASVRRPRSALASVAPSRH